MLQEKSYKESEQAGNFEKMTIRDHKSSVHEGMMIECGQCDL